MTRWASVRRTRAPRADSPPCASTPLGARSAALAVTAALFATSAATCGVTLLWAGPAQAQEPVLPPAAESVTPQGRTVAFDYSADVAPNDVYDTPRAQAPLPLFRALGDRVDVAAAYTGPSAHLRLVARLSSVTGWSTSVPLASEVEVEGRGRVGATIDLRRLEDRAELVAEQTRMPFEGMTVELVAAVRDDGGTWTPSVALQLSPQQLRLAGEPSSLVVRQEAAGADSTAAPAAPTPRSRLDDLLGWRPDGLLTTVALTLAAAGGTVVVRRRRDEDDADRARRRLGRLLLDVAPADLTGLRVVDVASPDALARLAERYGLLVLHWSDASGAVFVVQDETTAYRWTTGGPGHVDGVSETETETQAAAGPEIASVTGPGTATVTRPALLPDAADESATDARAQLHSAVAERLDAERLEAEVNRWMVGQADEQLVDRPPRQVGEPVRRAVSSVFEVG